MPPKAIRMTDLASAHGERVEGYHGSSAPPTPKSSAWRGTCQSVRNAETLISEPSLPS